MKVLFASDGGKQSDAAIEAVKKFALGQGDEIKIVSVVDMALPMAIDIYGGYLPDTAELEKTARDNAAKVVADAAEKVRGFADKTGAGVSTDVLFGSPDSRIVETAEEWKADLIV
ncbi:MAG: universal stress protein, partial [Acidobacteria bacterium]|nr:universal stress protein [Acidobacteriota bacterium]